MSPANPGGGHSGGIGGRCRLSRMFGWTATSNPPEVCGSKSTCTSSGSRSAEIRAPAPKCCAFVRPPTWHVPQDQRPDARQQRNRRRFECSSVHAARDRHLRGMADQAEAGHIGARVHGTRSGSACSASAATRLSVVIERIAASIDVAGRALELQRGRRRSPVPSGLVRSSSSPGRAPAFDQILAGSHLAGDGVAEFDFGVLHGVAAEQAPRRPPSSLSRPPLKIVARTDRSASFGKRRNGERRERTTAHRVDVAHRIGGGDLPVDERIVDDRREEVDCLDERPLAVEPVHTRIVRSPIVDQDPWVVRRGQIAQDLGELACRELARSTGAGRVVGQLLHLSAGHSLYSTSRRRAGRRAAAAPLPT